KEGLTPLHCWARWDEGDNPTAQLLLDKGADVNAKDKEGKTPLFYAVNKKDVSRAQLLLDKGADVNAKDKEGNTPLFCAVHNKDVPLAQLLLDKGADVNAKDSDGLALLHLAVQKQDEPMVRLLLEKGADANVQYCKTPLDMVADKEGAIAHLLQQYGGTTATLAQTAGALSSNLYSVFSSSSSSIDKESTNSHEASNADKPKEDEQIQLQK
ncbi:MAG: ankyrin-3-like, partial [Gammaproteobacteria bacterium]|nr:ankyrin-3-like [Gammaproteobacteria bacterium]